MNNPQLFSVEDKSYLKFNDIGIRNEGLWVYTNEQAQGMFIQWRHNPKYNSGQKSVYPVSKINDVWTNKLGWKKDFPLFKLHELIKTTKPILIVEGEKTCDATQKLFPNYFVTTWRGGCSNWKKTNWSSLKGKEEVIFWPDNDASGYNAMSNIARELSDQYNIQCKIVNVPISLPQGWDLADYKEDDDLNIYDLISNAELVKKFNYESIVDDINQKRWVFIKRSRKLYYDRFKKSFEHKETINELYKRDHDLGKGLATSKLHKEDIEVVDATAFWPTDKEYIYEGDNKYINTYKAKVFESLNVKASADDVNIFREHLKLVCNQDEESFNWLENTIAHDLQRPEVNRLWAVLIQGDYGLGKSVIFEAITHLIGEDNVEWVPSDAFATRFRDWLKKCCAIVCNEFNFEKYNKFGSNAYGMLNELITENKHFVESKGVDSYKHKGHYKIWLSSNDAVPIKLSPRDRRYFVTKIHTTKEIIFKKDPDYFKKLWAFIEDPECISKLYWYYKSTHQINDEVFDPKMPLMTQAKRILIAEGTPQVMRDLDVLFESKEGPFEFDIVNSTSIIDYVRLKERGTQDIPNPRGLFNKLTQDIITEWISKKQGVPIKNGHPVSLTPYEVENKKKRRYHAIRNQEHWIDCANLDELRAHMISKVKVAKKDEQSVF